HTATASSATAPPPTPVNTRSLHDALPISSLNEPYEIRFDKSGNMYFAEMQNRVVRRVDGKTKMISTLAGTGAHHAVLHLGEVHEIGKHTSELQSPYDLVCRLLLEKKKTQK